MPKGCAGLTRIQRRPKNLFVLVRGHDFGFERVEGMEHYHYQRFGKLVKLKKNYTLFSEGG